MVNYFMFCHDKCEVTRRNTALVKCALAFTVCDWPTQHISMTTGPLLVKAIWYNQKKLQNNYKMDILGGIVDCPLKCAEQFAMSRLLYKLWLFFFFTGLQFVQFRSDLLSDLKSIRHWHTNVSTGMSYNTETRIWQQHENGVLGIIRLTNILAHQIASQVSTPAK